MRELTVLGFDPGFANLGLALVRLFPDREEVLALTVIETEGSDKRRKVRAADDNVRRISEIAKAVNLYDPAGLVAVAAESMSFVRNASSSCKVGMTWGVLASYAVARGVPLLQATPQELKVKLCGSKGASKEDVQAALRGRYSNLAYQAGGIPRAKQEHAYDALAAVVTVLDGDVIQMARRLLTAAP